MTAPERTTTAETRTYRALSSQVRTRLLELLRAEPDLDAGTLATHLGLHVNTVRTHLNVLEEAGLVRPVVEERDRPGRPRLLYRVVEQPDEDAATGDTDGYRFLAGVLASYLGATSEDPEAAAEQAGTAWGRFVVDTPAPFSTVAPEAAVRRLVDMLEEFGFDPELDDRDPAAPRLLLRRCPFLDVAREHQTVVCSVHLGLMRGVLDEMGVEVEAQDLIPWAEPDVCISHLQVPAP